MRYKLLRFFSKRIFKTPQGQIHPKFIRVLYQILFPIKSYAEKRYGIRYDCGHDVYSIEGVKVPGEFFRQFSKKETIFKAVRKGDNITITKV